jgi:hypothetical protein
MCFQTARKQSQFKLVPSTSSGQALIPFDYAQDKLRRMEPIWLIQRGVEAKDKARISKSGLTNLQLCHFEGKKKRKKLLIWGIFS